MVTGLIFLAILATGNIVGHVIADPKTKLLDAIYRTQTVQTLDGEGFVKNTARKWLDNKLPDDREGFIRMLFSCSTCVGTWTALVASIPAYGFLLDTDVAGYVVRVWATWMSAYPILGLLDKAGKALLEKTELDNVTKQSVLRHMEEQ